MVARLVRSSVAVTPISAIPFVYASIQMFLACFWCILFSWLGILLVSLWIFGLLYSILVLLSVIFISFLFIYSLYSMRCRLM